MMAMLRWPQIYRWASKVQKVLSICLVKLKCLHAFSFWIFRKLYKTKRKARRKKSKLWRLSRKKRCRLFEHFWLQVQKMMSKVNNAQFSELHAPLRYGGGRRRRFVRNLQKGVVQSNQLLNVDQTFPMFPMVVRVQRVNWGLQKIAKAISLVWFFKGQFLVVV